MFEVQLLQQANVVRAEQAVAAWLGATDELHASTSERVVRFATTRGEPELSELLAQLAGAGLGVSQFREIEADLEEAFLSMTDPRRQMVAAPPDAPCST
jgi:ABC-2 type transport system ATP-binding protein